VSECPDPRITESVMVVAIERNIFVERFLRKCPSSQISESIVAMVARNPWRA
jgi:hypothetical protein